MSSIVVIVSIPTEAQEKFLKDRNKKRVSIKTDETNNINSIRKKFTMEQLLRFTLKELNITDATWHKSEDEKYYQIIIPMECDHQCEIILETLKHNGIGDELNSRISILPCTLIHYHGKDSNINHLMEEEEESNMVHYNEESGWNLFRSSVKSRLTVAQVVENVKAKAAMTFDCIVLLLVSTMMCALGLVENNSICMVSSMLICPMMGPVMAGTFGTVIQDRHLQKTGVRNELIGLAIATLVGFVIGTIICLATDKYGTSDWPTYEMYSRGELRALGVGAILAVLSGAAVALAILSDNISSLVGVAISTSLMPPAVNAGLLWSLGLIYYLKNDEVTRYASLTHTDYFSKNSAIELTALGAISICLTFINYVCIYVAGILVFKMKEVAPHSAKDEIRTKFWKHDIRVAREYNQTVNSVDDFKIMTRRASVQVVNFKSELPLRQYTWSPCLFSRQSAVGHAKLSQIFPQTRPTMATETTPLLPSHTLLLASGKKVTVTPCDTP